MDKVELMRQLISTFVEEVAEHVSELNTTLLALEKEPAQATDRYKALFRTVHSLKGAARSVNVGLIERACHHLEDVLGATRDQRIPLSPELFALLFKTVDAIEEATMRLREGAELTGAPLAALVPQLEQAAMSPVASVPSVPPVAPVPPAPVKPAVAPPEATPAVPTASPKPASPASSAPATVRIPAAKLDSLLAQSGELLVARRRLEFRVGDLMALRDSAAAWNAEWRNVEKPLRQLLQANSEHEGRTTQSPPRLPRRAAALLAQTGERLRKLEKDLDQLTSFMVAGGRMLAQTCDALDDEVHRVRMLPFDEACGGLERAVRDLARTTGKEVRLVIEGQDVEMDRSVLEGLKDPLLHLVRNAVDHGLETVAERRTLGKPTCGTVTVSAAFRGAHVEVVVADDGRGFDLEKIRDKVRKKGLTEPQDDRELARMVFLPGFSTATMITDVSGRGVGLDVVLTRLEALHGAVDVQFEAQRGARFTLTVPLTLTTIRTVLVSAGGQTFGIATSNVRQLVRVSATNVGSLGGRDVLLLGGVPIPLASLAETLGLTPSVAGNTLLGVVVTFGDQRVALIVDEIMAEQDVVVKNLGARVRRVRHVSGATLLPSGRVALVLNVANLVRLALGRAPTQPLLAGTVATPETRKRLLVVEDSITTRTLMKSILETAGYDVTVAVDGQQAWELLPDANVDLVVSDIDMPRKDGFALTEAIRNSKRFAELPVVLVTARETDEDKARGAQAGANAYLVKTAFDQRNLLESIAQLL